MFFNQSRQFFSRFPGPFNYVRGSEGVDHTFDIICVSTEQPIISTYYWEDRYQAELVARVVTDALNEPLLAFEHDETMTYDRRGIAKFRSLHPGPFTVRRSHCDYHGPSYEVNCTTSGECVIIAVQWSSKRVAKMISKQIAMALNSLIEAVETPKRLPAISQDQLPHPPY